MASRATNKTTFAKLNREARLRERRSEKAARKRARREQADDPTALSSSPIGEDDLTAPAELATTHRDDDSGA